MIQPRQNIIHFQFHEYTEREGFHRYPCYDIVVDGRNVMEYFPDYAQYVTPFGLGFKDVLDDLGPIDEFCGKRKPESVYGVPFLICGECHDPGCGGVWGQIEIAEAKITWSRFTEGDGGLQFCFEKNQYLKAFAELEKEIRRRHSSNQ